MALLWAENFEYYGLAATGVANMQLGAWVKGLGEIQTGVVRTGGAACRVVPSEFGQKDMSRIIRPANNEVIIAFGFNTETFPGAGTFQLFGIMGANDKVIMSLSPRNLGDIALYGPDGVQLGVTSPCLNTNTWHHVQVRVLQDSIIGEIEVRVDNEVVIALSHLNLGDTEMGMLHWGTTSVNTPGYIIDDIIVFDTTGDVNNDFPGPARVLLSSMTSSGPANGWSVTGAASAHEAVNDIPQDGNTSYIRAEVAGDTQQFGVSALPPEVESVIGVFIPFVAKLDDAGAGSVKVGVVSDGETSLSEEITLGNSYSYRGVAIEKDPATNSKFTKASFEAATFQITKSS